MKRRTLITTTTLVAISGCASQKKRENTTNRTENDTSTTPPQESSFSVVSVTDNPQIPEKYHGRFKSGKETVILEIPDSNQLYISQELSLPNPAYVLKRDVSVSNEGDLIINYSAEDNSPPNVAAPSVIQPSKSRLGIEISNFQPNTIVEINTISGETITHKTTEGESITKIQ